eukprot:6205798-Pleurochrysis_carterae.AAC.1
MVVCSARFVRTQTSRLARHEPAGAARHRAEKSCFVRHRKAAPAYDALVRISQGYAQLLLGLLSLPQSHLRTQSSRAPPVSRS